MPSVKIHQIDTRLFRRNPLFFRGIIGERLQDAIDKSGKLTTCDIVYEHLTTGLMELWFVAVADGKEDHFAGWFIAETMGQEQKIVNLPFAWADPKWYGEIDLMGTVLEKVAEMVKGMEGYVGVMISSLRKGYWRRIKEYGFRPVAYLKEV